MTDCPKSFSPTPSAPFYKGRLFAFSTVLTALSCFLHIVLLCGVPEVLPLMRCLTAHILLEDFGTSNLFWKDTDIN